MRQTMRHEAMLRDFRADATEKRLVAAARAYLGVPFRHQGRNRHGLDCLGLLVCVARDCDLRRGGRPLCSWDMTDYGHLPDETRLRNGLAQVMCPVQTQAVRPGDILQFRVDGAARHLGIAGDYAGSGLSLIHAYAPARRVVEHRLDASWQAAIWQVWRVAEESKNQSATGRLRTI